MESLGKEFDLDGNKVNLVPHDQLFYTAVVTLFDFIDGSERSWLEYFCHFKPSVGAKLFAWAQQSSSFELLVGGFDCDPTGCIL